MKKRELVTLLISTILILGGIISCSNIENNSSKRKGKESKPSVLLTPVNLDEEESVENTEDNSNTDDNNKDDNNKDDNNRDISNNDDRLYDKNSYSEELMDYIHQGDEKKFYDILGSLTYYRDMSCISINEIDEQNEIKYNVRTSGNILKDKEIIQTVDSEKITELNTLKSLVNEKDILKLPIVEGNKWNQKVVIDDKIYVMNHEIEKVIIETSYNRKRVVVKSTIENIEGYEDNTYYETAIYDKGVGLVYLDMKPRIEDIMSGRSATRLIERLEGRKGTYRPVDVSNIYN